MACSVRSVFAKIVAVPDRISQNICLVMTCATPGSLMDPVRQDSLVRFQVSSPSRMFVLLCSQDLKQLARTLCCASEFAGAQTRILKWGPSCWSKPTNHRRERSAASCCFQPSSSKVITVFPYNMNRSPFKFCVPIIVRKTSINLPSLCVGTEHRSRTSIVEKSLRPPTQICFP